MKFEWVDRFGDKACVEVLSEYDRDDPSDFLELEAHENHQQVGSVLTEDQALDLFLFLERALFSDEF